MCCKKRRRRKEKREEEEVGLTDRCIVIIIVLLPPLLSSLLLLLQCRLFRCLLFLLFHQERKRERERGICLFAFAPHCIITAELRNWLQKVEENVLQHIEDVNLRLVTVLLSIEWKRRQTIANPDRL